MSEGDKRGRVVGIDLGTTFSAVAYLKDNGEVETIPNAEGEFITPSVVCLDENDTVLVGAKAKAIALADPDCVADCIKRDMGEELYHRAVRGMMYSPSYLSAMILKKLKQDTEAAIGPIAGAVISVPAYFDEGRRQATIDAGCIAGLTVLDLIDEPTSAAMAYAYRDFFSRGGGMDAETLAVAMSAPHNAIVYDLGGGTLDVSVVRIAGNELTVLATEGDVWLGGYDWDEFIVKSVAKAFKKTHGMDLLSTSASAEQLRQTAEKAKCELSDREETEILVAFEGHDGTVVLTRDQFEEMTAPLLYRTEVTLKSALAEAKSTWDEIDEVLLVGGSTRMPQVRQMLQRVTGKEPNCTLSPDEVVAHGAAIFGVVRAFELKMTQDARLRAKSRIKATGDSGAEADVPGEAGIEALLPDDDILGQDFDFNDIAIDEGVAESLKGVKASSVNAHSLGIVVCRLDGEKRVAVLISRNTELPARQTRRFALECDNQVRVCVDVVEGESKVISDCIKIGSCVIDNLPLGLLKGSPVDVTFAYDGSGCLHVHAVVASSDLEASVQIERERGMDRRTMRGAKEAMTGLQVV